MPKVYRTMRKGEDNKPVVGVQFCMLGARVPVDIRPDADGNVHPGDEGMSVSRDLRAMPAHLIPKRLRPVIPGAAGKDSYFIWSMGTGPFAAGPMTDNIDLRLDTARDGHGFFAPNVVMQLDAYQEALARTQDDWSEDETA